MKGLGANRSRHLSDSCEPAGCSQKPLCPLTSDPHIGQGTAAKMNRLPSSLLDQLERHLPLQRDGFSTLQFHRGRMSKQRSESPGRIRHLMHSVQKLFAKSQSLENSAIKGSLNGRSAGGMTGTTGSGEDSGRPTRRSKSKDRAKTEGQKQRPRPSTLGLWGSDDALDTDTTKAGTIAVGYRNPLSMMTLGRAVSDSQAPPRHIPQGYNTISAHTLKTSKSSSDLKFLACPDDTLVKRGSWSTLTLTQARQVLQKGSATVNRTMLKSKSCHQDLAQQFLQVPLGDWAGTLGHGKTKGTEIPCRRMRSGSYVKAMGAVEDSDDSEGSPKPSPKSAARRLSYMKATQQSLSYSWISSIKHSPLLIPELSTNRSLDNLDCLVSPLERVSLHTFFQVCGQGCGHSVPYCEGESQAVEALDLPAPTCFRSRSHSYLRAIQAGCSQDEDTASVDSESPPPTTPGYSYSSNTSDGSVCFKLSSLGI
uniref:DLG associated protein 4 n=1 Tax=Maylandia zebra TaxID=106582 RepID=A0A3P9DLE9_9CICH